jgi:NAD(P)-dependent dehydrogenase (short-subunit alcohol dehydrogenase family)
MELKQLVKIFGADNVTSDPTTLEKYSRDESFVNPIKPEYVVKPRNSDDIAKLVAFMGELAKGIPLGREGTVDDIASAALFLASDESSYITGDSIRVGGGMPNRAGP